jgi:peptidoglycan-associated lipoprotein
MNFKFIAIAALGAFATACASTPPMETVEPPTPPPARHEPAAPMGPADGSVEQFVATAGDRVFYGLDRHDLTAEGRATLRAQAAWLATYSNTRILVAGNCDERGTREYNLALGARRANAARDYLISQGVDPSRISTVSYGKERGTCTQSNEACWSVNRNAITSIVSGATS